MMGLIGSPVTSVRNDHYALRNNAEERGSHLLHDRSLKSCVDEISFKHHLRPVWQELSWLRENMGGRTESHEQLFLHANWE